MNISHVGGNAGKNSRPGRRGKARYGDGWIWNPCVVLPLQSGMRGDTDGWLTVFDKNGTAQFVTLIGGTGEDFLNGLLGGASSPFPLLGRDFSPEILSLAQSSVWVALTGIRGVPREQAL